MCVCVSVSVCVCMCMCICVWCRRRSQPILVARIFCFGFGNLGEGGNPYSLLGFSILVSGFRNRLKPILCARILLLGFRVLAKVQAHIVC